MSLHAEDDREFLDIMEGFSVSEEELAAMVRMPALSIRDVKQRLQGAKSNSRHGRQSSPAHGAR